MKFTTWQLPTGNVQYSYKHLYVILYHYNALLLVLRLEQEKKEAVES